MTQPAISREIKTLEHQLGQPLFRRVNRALQLTRAGQELLQAAEEALGLLDGAIDRRALVAQPRSIPPRIECSRRIRRRGCAVEPGQTRCLRGRRGQHGDRFPPQVSAAGRAVALSEHSEASACFPCRRCCGQRHAQPCDAADLFHRAYARCFEATDRRRWASTQLRFAFELCGSLIGALLFGF